MIYASLFSQSNQKIKLKNGVWLSQLFINETDVLPFELEITKIKKSYQFTIYNGEERIQLSTPEISEDSLRIRFPYFNSELVYHIDSKKEITGYWYNYNKNNYSIPTKARPIKKGERFSFIYPRAEENSNLSGKWAVTFEPKTNSSYPAVGIFKQDNNKVTGTFLTETGDYRFLSGNTHNDSLYLSCFDGSHAFLFKASYKNDTMNGNFFSGKHWKSEWVGIKDSNSTLRNPEEITYVENEQEVEFTLKTLDGQEYIYPNDSLENKVVIIQIMGSWCPNCLDETRYYKSLYANYHEKGLEIISIGYETGDDFATHAANIDRLKKKLSLNFTFLVGGSAKKSLASEHFGMLNEVISFPTSIFIGKDGKVKRVHTGFNGPGTGSYYTEYIEKTNALIESMLAE